MNQPTDRVGEGQAGPSAPRGESLYRAALTVHFTGFCPDRRKGGHPPCGMCERVALALEESARLAGRASEAALAEAQEQDGRMLKLAGDTIEAMRVELATMTKERDKWHTAYVEFKR